jgi:hypothetical protein
MAEQRMTMILWRDNSKELAYLQYSWVPTGTRQDIKLSDGVDEDSCIDSIIPPTDIKQVQVYELYSDDLVAADATDNWYLPQAARTSSVIHAAIEIFSKRREVVGTLHYADGSTWSDTRPLKPRPPVP